MGTAEIALIISILSFVVSAISLWVSRISPPNLDMTYSTPTLTIYKITKAGETWWIPSFDASFSFLNKGGRAGKVKDLRILAEWKGYRESRKYEFYPSWVVDYARFHSDRKDRSQWKRSAVLSKWYAIQLQGHSEKHIHVVLEGPRWHAEQNGNILCNLEILEISTRESAWISLAKYEFTITRQMFSDTSIVPGTLRWSREGTREPRESESLG
jgi:hypothetical protein